MFEWSTDLAEAEATGFEPLPAGKYNVRVEEAELTQTKSGTGLYIKAKFLVIDGSAEGRVFFHNFNVKNDNDTAQKIGLGQLKRMIECAGGKAGRLTSDMTPLLGLRTGVTLKIREAQGDYGAQNNVTSFNPMSSPAMTVDKKDVPF